MRHLSDLSIKEFKKYFPSKYLGSETNINSIINSLDNFAGFHYAISKYGIPDTYMNLENNGFDVRFLLRRQLKNN